MAVTERERFAARLLLTYFLGLVGGFAWLLPSLVGRDGLMPYGLLNALTNTAMILGPLCVVLVVWRMIRLYRWQGIWAVPAAVISILPPAGVSVLLWNCGKAGVCL